MSPFPSDGSVETPVEKWVTNEKRSASVEGGKKPEFTSLFIDVIT